MCSYVLAANGLGLGEEGELKAQMLNIPQMFIEVQMLNLALLPLFRQTLVSRCCFFFNYFVSFLKFQLIKGNFLLSFTFQSPI